MQIDFGERLVEIGGVKLRVYLFVATLGYSRRSHIRAFRNERQESWFDGLESAFTKFGGVTEEVLFDNPRALVGEHRGARSHQRPSHQDRHGVGWSGRPRLRKVQAACDAC